MERNFTPSDNFLGDNQTIGNESSMARCGVGQLPVEWNYVHEVFTCVGILLTVLSCVGNSVTIVFIRKTSVLHSPTFTGIACLAFSDMVAAIFRFLKFRSHAIFVMISGCNNRQRFVFEDSISVLSFLTLNSSYFHLTMLSVVRYRLISRPFKTYVGLTCRTVLRYSVVCWALALIASIVYGAKVLTVSHTHKEQSDILEIAFVVYLFSITIIPLLTIHILKIRKLRKSLVVNRQHEIRMHAMMAVISITTVVCIVPIAGLLLHKTIGHASHTLSRRQMFIESQLSQVCLALNHAVHPLLYFVLSELMKTRLRPSQNDVIKKSLLAHKHSLKFG